MERSKIEGGEDGREKVERRWREERVGRRQKEGGEKTERW